MNLAPFLSLDGIDGTGKTTQCRLLVEWLNAAGVRAIGCGDPGGTPLGDQLRQILLASAYDLSPRAEALLFMASRSELVARVIRPALESGEVVVSDRFVMANVVYQGHARGIPPEEVWAVGRFSTGGILPDLTIVLDLPVEQAISRRARTADRMEGRGHEYLDKVRQGFRAEAARQPEKVVLVDASPDADIVQRRLREIVGVFLSSRGLVIGATE
ncbi:MAG TPA: dTMP kinase [Gemmataceae bacterium]|nr:dTMP kinase [Gemmataceae bacterium]